MYPCHAQKVEEVLDVPLTNTSADPRTVVIMHLHAYPADAAMEGPRRSQQLTRFTPTQLLQFEFRIFIPG